MTRIDEENRLSLAQALMAEITERLENLAGLAADQQLSATSTPKLLEGVAAVHDLVRAHSRLLPAPRPRPTQARRKT